MIQFKTTKPYLFETDELACGPVAQVRDKTKEVNIGHPPHVLHFHLIILVRMSGDNQSRFKMRLTAGFGGIVVQCWVPNAQWTVVVVLLGTVG